MLVLAVAADVAPGGWAASNATALETHKTTASVLTVLRCPQGNDQATQASEIFVAIHRKRKTGSRIRRTSSSTTPLRCGRLFGTDELVLGLRRLLQAAGVRRGSCSNSQKRPPAAPGGRPTASGRTRQSVPNDYDEVTDKQREGRDNVKCKKFHRTPFLKSVSAASLRSRSCNDRPLAIDGAYAVRGIANRERPPCRPAVFGFGRASCCCVRSARVSGCHAIPRPAQRASNVIDGLIIRGVASADFDAWLPLWDANL